MAAPTDVRVEAISQTGTMLRWTYSGSGNLSVYRSPDGITYASITIIASTSVEYEDSGLSSATKYWYKVSDDAGATFSSVVTVWTQNCLTEAGEGNDINLPRAADEVTPGAFNQAMEELERTVEAKLLNRDPCEVCISDGRVVIDCSTGCSDFHVNVTEDVNSISVLWCSDTTSQPGGPGPLGATINWHVPANTTRKICGFPRGSGFSGDECFRSPIVGGSDGRSVSSEVGPQSKSPASKKGPGGVTGTSAGGSGGGGCTCVPGKNNQLTIKSCTTNNSMSCSSTKSLTLLACGGRPPYAWSKTGSIALSATAGIQTKVTPPTNTGSGVAGQAYWLQCMSCAACIGAACASCGPPITSIWGCNDAQQGNCSTTAAGCGAFAGGPTCASLGLDSCCPPGLCDPDPGLNCADAIACTSPKARSGTCDKRTAQMITDGCNPCGISVDGTTVTVTDSMGTSVTISLRA